MRASISSPFARATPSTEPRLVRMAETSTPHRTVAPLVRAAARSASVRLSGPPRRRRSAPPLLHQRRVPQEVERRPGGSRAHGGVANAPRPEHATQRFVVDCLAHEIRDGHRGTRSVSWICRLPRCRRAFASVRPLKPSAGDGDARSEARRLDALRNWTKRADLAVERRNPSASLGRPVRSSVAVRAGSRHNVRGSMDGANATTSARWLEGRTRRAEGLGRHSHEDLPGRRRQPARARLERPPRSPVRRPPGCGARERACADPPSPGSPPPPGRCGRHPRRPRRIAWPRVAQAALWVGASARPGGRRDGQTPHDLLLGGAEPHIQVS